MKIGKKVREKFRNLYIIKIGISHQNIIFCIIDLMVKCIKMAAF